MSRKRRKAPGERAGDAWWELSKRNPIQLALIRARMTPEQKDEMTIFYCDHLHSQGKLEQMIFSKLQRGILKLLDGQAQTADELCRALGVGNREISRSTLFGKGGITELTEVELVKNNRPIGGYYRPDRPPRPQSNESRTKVELKSN